MTSRKFRKSPGAGFGQYPDSVFSQQGMEDLHPQMVKQARKSGQLNLSNRGLTMVPERVWTIMEFDKEETKELNNMNMDSKVEDNWWDQVDMTKLILACNKISVISPLISNLGSLTVLDLHDNQLDQLPESVGELTLVSKLNLSHNKFKAVPEGIFKMKDLRVLQLNNNLIEEVSEGISEIDMVNTLDLGNNKIKSLPGNFGFLVRISKLNLANNLLETLPNEMNSMTALSSLDLTNNQIYRIPSSMKELSHLEVLYLRQNKLTNIPELNNCINLKELHLGSNQIAKLTPQELENIVNVRTLDLRENKITSIPDEITGLQQLERIDVSNNDLSTLPFTLGMMPHLKAVQVEGNPMKAIRRDIIARGTVGLLKYLRSRLEEGQVVELSKASGNVSPLPVLSSSPPIPDKFTMKTSQSLNLSKKGLTDLPEEAVENALEAQVQSLDLSKNSLAEVPTNMERLMPQLYELNLSSNKLTTLASFFGAGQLIQFLDFSNNKLSQLPEALSTMKHLREVILSVNQFTSIPECLYSCQKLETLLIANNQVSTLDVEKMSQMTNLAILDLQNNAIQNIPPELGNLTQIRTIQLEGNLFRVPRTSILVQGTGAIMAYLRDRIPK